MKRVGVIDYGVGNLGSVARAVEKVGAEPFIVDRARDLSTVDGLILPGVGNFADCAKLLLSGGWESSLRDEVLGNGRALLGICVGMQLLATGSSEGARDSVDVRGLGFIAGSVRHLSALGCNMRVPHVGWNSICRARTEVSLFSEVCDGTDFYFVHSYAFVPDDERHILATAEYGISFVAAVQRANVWGTQFHPEKSSRAGFQILRNFVDAIAC